MQSPSYTSWTAVNEEQHCIISALCKAIWCTDSLSCCRETAGRVGLSCLKVKVNRAVAALLNQEVKGAVQRKDVLAMHSRTSPKPVQARKCTSLQAFPLACIFKVTWHVCFFLKRPWSSYSCVPCVTKTKKLLYHNDVVLREISEWVDFLVFLVTAFFSEKLLGDISLLLPVIFNLLHAFRKSVFKLFPHVLGWALH